VRKIYLPLCLLVLLLQSGNVHSREGAWDLPESRSVGQTLKHGLIAGTESLLFNGLLFVFDAYILRAPWAIVTPESIKANLTNPWVWEEDIDGYKVNLFGHPYHGSLYYNTGRANGFGFFSSVFFNAIGSLTWELFCENEPPALNDFFVTTIGSISLGEMLFRLYLEAHAAGFPEPVAFLISPMASLNRLFGWKPPGAGGNIFEFRGCLGGAFAYSNASVWETGMNSRNEIFSFKGMFVTAGVKVIYGNPFEQDTRVPLRHFELAMSLGADIGNYLDISFFSDAYLLSFSPIFSDKNKMSTGLSVQLDGVSQGRFAHDGAINMFSNALDWTLKYQRQISGNTVFQVKIHSGLTFLGASIYYWPVKGIYEPKNFGYGFNSKLYLNLEKKKTARLEADTLFCAMWTYPETARFSDGQVLWLFANISYSRFVSEKFSLGVTSSFAFEWGTFTDYPGTQNYNNTVKMHVSWNL